MEFYFATGTNEQRTYLSGGTYPVPRVGKGMWTTDTKKLYIGDGTTNGGILVGPISEFSGLTNTAHTHNYTAPYTNVVFDNITATSLTTTGSSVHTTTLYASVVTGTSISATTYYCGSTNLTSLLGSSDHGSLTGLYDNDHPQYRLTASTAAISASTFYSGTNDLLNVLSPSGHTHAYSAITSTGHTHIASQIGGASAAERTFSGGLSDVYYFPSNMGVKGDTISVDSDANQADGQSMIEFRGGAAWFLYNNGAGEFRLGPAGKNTVVYGDCYVGGNQLYLSNPIGGAGGNVNVDGSGIYFGTGSSHNLTYRSTPVQISASTTFIAPTITATTYCGITASMVNGSQGLAAAVPAEPVYFGNSSGNSVVGVGNHFFVDNTYATGLNSTIYWRTTGDTKWGIETSANTSDLNIYKVGSHNGIIRFDNAIVPSFTSSTILTRGLVISGDGGQSILSFKGAGADTNITLIHAAGQKLFMSDVGLNNMTSTISISSPVISGTDYYCGSSKGYLLNNTDYSVVTGMTYSNNEPTGFINTNLDSTLGFTALTRTFGISPTGGSFEVMVNGKLYTKSTTETVVIADEWGLHHIVYSANGVLTTLGTGATYLDFMFNNAYVANVFWDKGISGATGVGDERHGCVMDPSTHHYLHSTYGSKYVNGFLPSGMTMNGDGTNDQHAVVGFGSGEFWDEDIRHIKTGSTTGATIPVVYMSGNTGQWRQQNPRIHPVYTAGGSLVAYNGFNGSQWGMSAATSGQYVLYHFFGVNSTTYSVIAIPGQNQYTTAASAKSAAKVELDGIILSGLPWQEFVPICTTIYLTNSSYSNQSKAALVTTDGGDNYVDWRGRLTIGYENRDHGMLAGLSGDDHTHYQTSARTEIQITGSNHLSLSASTYSGITLTKSLTVPNVQAAENITMFYLNRNIVFKNAWTVLSGVTPSVTWALVSGSSKAAAVGTITGATSSGPSSSGAGLTYIIANRSVPSGSWIWLTTSATGGTTNEFHITVEYTEK